MIHTAHEHIEKSFKESPDYTSVYDIYVRAINEARREIVKECAEAAKVLPDSCPVWNCEGERIDKQSILKLIDQIK